MDTDKKTEIQVETLVKENERLSVDIRALESMIDKFMGFGVTVIGIGFTYGVEKDLFQVYLFLPIALLGLLLFTIDRMRSQMWLGGYKHAVEDKINEITGAVVVKWEELVSKHRGRGDVIIISTYFIYFFLFGGICAYCLYGVYHADQSKINPLSSIAALNWFKALSAVIVSLLILLGLSLRQQLLAYDKAYATSRFLFELPRLPGHEEIYGRLANEKNSITVQLDS